jgi:hypothetical protein
MNTKALDLSALNAQSQAWTTAVGEYFRNFALIEWLTVELLHRMADPFKYKSTKKKFLPQKLTWIIDNLHERADGDEEKAEALIELLESIREETYFRNVAAHGALGLVFPPEGGNPSLSGILNFKPDDESQDAEMISLEEIQGRRDEAAALAAKLLDAMNSMEFTPIV